jgi:NADH-quinone oxidoreductase subunit E
MADFGPIMAFWTQQAEMALQVNLRMMQAAMVPWQMMGWRVSAPDLSGRAVSKTKPAPKAPAAGATPASPPAAKTASTTSAGPVPRTAPLAMPPVGAVKPAGLDAPRGGKADSLVAIKGLGPKLEEALNAIGIYHYDQIAGWSVAEIAWIDANLGTIRGRASRDDWKAQAAALARSDDA